MHVNSSPLLHWTARSSLERAKPSSCIDLGGFRRCVSSVENVCQPGDYGSAFSLAPLAEPSKKSPMPGEMGAEVVLWGDRGTSLVRERTLLRMEEGELHWFPHRVASSSSLSLSSWSCFSSSSSSCTPATSSYFQATRLPLFLSFYGQPLVVFHLTGAPLKPTNRHRIPYSERSCQCCGEIKRILLSSRDMPK